MMGVDNPSFQPPINGGGSSSTSSSLSSTGGTAPGMLDGGVVFSPPAATPWYVRLSWALATVASVAAPVVTIVFFATLWHGGHLGMGNINVHVLNLVFVVFDHVVSARPVRLVHAAYVLVYGTCYLVFNYTIYVTKGVIVYPILDWGKNPGGAVATGLILCLVGIPLVQLFYYGLYRLKCWICVQLFNAEV